MVKTTVNFLQTRLDTVFEAARKSGVGYKQLVKMCLTRFLADFENERFEERALLYQSDAENWRKVHMKMEFWEYDAYFDCKKVIRWSFSLIVAVAIDTYLESIINQDQEFSYHLDSYTKLCALEENYPIYVFSWKKNEKTEKIREILRE
jgi:hypothetical protein